MAESRESESKWPYGSESFIKYVSRYAMLSKLHKGAGCLNSIWPVLLNSNNFKSPIKLIARWFSEPRAIYECSGCECVSL